MKFELFNLTETFAHPKMLIFATSKENVQTNTFDKCTNPRVPHKTLAPQDVAQDSRPPSDRGTEPWANLKCKVRRSSISHEAPYTPRPEPLGQWFLKQTHLFYLKMFAKSLVPEKKHLISPATHDTIDFFQKQQPEANIWNCNCLFKQNQTTIFDPRSTDKHNGAGKTNCINCMIQLKVTELNLQTMHVGDLCCSPASCNATFWTSILSWRSATAKNGASPFRFWLHPEKRSIFGRPKDPRGSTTKTYEDADELEAVKQIFVNSSS